MELAEFKNAKRVAVNDVTNNNHSGNANDIDDCSSSSSRDIDSIRSINIDNVM